MANKKRSSDAIAAQPTSSWRDNISRNGGFWADDRWYDLQIERRMPHVLTMWEELLFAFPPVRKGGKVLDLLAGSGRASIPICKAYPHIDLTILDQNAERTAIAAHSMQQQGLPAPTTIHLALDISALPQALPGGHYCAIIASLSLRVVVQRPSHYNVAFSGEAASGSSESQAPPLPPPPPLTEAGVQQHYRAVFGMLLQSLEPGGTLLIGDHDGSLGLFLHMKLMDECGFEEVDCAWRLREYFVCAGRRPLD
jgi:hypothetical protein